MRRYPQQQADSGYKDTLRGTEVWKLVVAGFTACAAIRGVIGGFIGYFIGGGH